ncbi:3-deoxy-manno-octulosonate cytidylyltransferase [Candidatus Methylospira mobilis]|uniref:3-deoxy-manno-octulosonate cytidylyltransferase n=1 Tax=Candidatus Methylospira mobilis TaxID=1808979 RepID=A0A5Q0BK16_9GAMM|nr:3-deoxy-manno-octulosonate cytidylyltransferase [Candidatus Methylospira mobilis]QFY42524.1 3-deoxy-manno-octulosonate cytidylyltransferase [Candidatus Methylospira mobilis]WNV04369.1 3-deoxy-manno-octulosonate cytidylyltransferase [Candidatus Methylospira mobilis]
MKRDFKIVIPARMGSSRLPGKPMRLLAGQPMIAHVCDRALESGASEVVVATDDERILQVAESRGVAALMTREDHASGTERIAEVIERLGWADHEIVVNLQGDEPLMRPQLLGQLATALAPDCGCEMATLAAPLDTADVFNPHAVKVVLDGKGHALYFSRAPIPWDREAFADEQNRVVQGRHFLRHVGTYAYTAGFIRRYVEFPASELESIECLEQLRVLWMGERIKVLRIDQPPEASVDTEADLIRVNALMEQIETV